MYTCRELRLTCLDNIHRSLERSPERRDSLDFFICANLVHRSLEQGAASAFFKKNRYGLDITHRSLEPEIRVSKCRYEAGVWI